MPDTQPVDAVLEAFNRRGPYLDRQRGLLKHHWPSLYQALRALDGHEPHDIALAASEQQLTSASAGIALVARERRVRELHRTRPCPDCRDGKHRSCAGFAFDGADRQVPCPCEQAGHGTEPS